MIRNRGTMQQMRLFRSCILSSQVEGII